MKISYSFFCIAAVLYVDTTLDMWVYDEWCNSIQYLLPIHNSETPKLFYLFI